MASIKLKGLHQVRKVNADGSSTWHIYAWRGGPKIATSPHKVHVADDALISSYQRAYSRPVGAAIPSDSRTLKALLDEWQASAEFRALRAGTRKDYEDQVAKIESGEWHNRSNGKSVRLASLTLRDLEDKRVRGVLFAWRDENFAHKPRTADKVIGTLSACFTWGVDRGKLAHNQLLGTAKLHKVNRSEVIWTEADLDKVRPFCSADVWRAAQLSLCTGLALADVVRLPWSAINGDAIEGRRVKTNREYLIPVLPALATLLADTPRRSPTVLTNAYGRPWSKSGLSHAFGEAKTKAGIPAKGPGFHDLRGTAATRFIAAGLSYAQVGAILGWDEKRVEDIARRYVDRKTVVAAMLQRIAPARPMGS